MGALGAIGVEEDEPKPVQATPEVRAKLEALFRDPESLRRLFKIGHGIVKKGGGMRRRNPHSGEDRPLYGNDLVEELVMEAVTRVLEGRRKWDFARVPDAFVFFGGVIGSLWTHFARDEKRRKEREAVAEEDRPFDWRTRNAPTPLELLIAKEEEEEYQLLRADFEAEFDPDKKGGRLALDYLALTQDEIYDPCEQARRLGISMDDVYVLRRRIKRVLERFLAERKGRGRTLGPK